VRGGGLKKHQTILLILGLQNRTKREPFIQPKEIPEMRKEKEIEKQERW
jgi:hypothetical protein